MTVDQLYHAYNRLNRLLWHPRTRKRRRKVQRLMRQYRSRAEAMMHADRTLPQYNFDYVSAHYEVRFAVDANAYRTIKHGPPPSPTIINPNNKKWILPIIYQRPI